MTQNLEMHRGNSTEWDVAVTRYSQMVDLTGASLWFTAKLAKDAVTSVFQKTIGSGITVTSAVDGEIRIQMDPSDTATLPSSIISLYYDLEIQTGTGEVFTIADGRLVVKPDITVR